MLGSRLLCLFNRHRPARDTVEWNGHAFVGQCKRCSAEIRRRDEGGWRRQTSTEEAIFKAQG
jgi:hypothetical protein